jgi:hypothetical protein
MGSVVLVEHGVCYVRHVAPCVRFARHIDRVVADIEDRLETLMSLIQTFSGIQQLPGSF